jgi:hypothetical protein
LPPRRTSSRIGGGVAIDVAKYKRATRVDPLQALRAE